MIPHKITPSLWFSNETGCMADILAYYQQIFGADFIAGNTIPLGTTPSGYTEMCEVLLFERKYALMCTEKPHHPFNDALAFTINCADQAEIDKYWDYFTHEGKEVQCGWCIDKYGLRWQVLPFHFGELMRRPNAWQVMMQQKKIVIEAYLP